VEEKQPTERKEDMRKATSQQKQRWANQKAESLGSMEVTRRFDF